MQELHTGEITLAKFTHVHANENKHKLRHGPLSKWYTNTDTDMDTDMDTGIVMDYLNKISPKRLKVESVKILK
jgi:hypothetical protein